MFVTVFDTLQAPPDLATARARLQALVEVMVDEISGASTAPGPVQHLDRPGGAGTDRWPAIDPTAPVVVADGVLWQATGAQLAALSASLRRGQVLVFLEPTAEIGWRRTVQRVGRPLWRRLSGHHFDTDVPEDLRRAGLQVTDLNRFGVGPAELRSYALGRAEHIR